VGFLDQISEAGDAQALRVEVDATQDRLTIDSASAAEIDPLVLQEALQHVFVAHHLALDELDPEATRTVEEGVEVRNGQVLR